MAALISPSLLSADAARLGEEVRAIEAAGADSLHWDIMDGHYVPNLSFSAAIVKALRPYTLLPFDVHLMVTSPEAYVEAFLDAGAAALIIHPDSTTNPIEVLGYIRRCGAIAGVAINPGQAIEAWPMEMWALVERIIILTVRPGFGGQVFLPAPLNLIPALKQCCPQAQISVDGGMNALTAPLAWQAGADIIIAGNYIFSAASYVQAIESLRCL